MTAQQEFNAVDMAQEIEHVLVQSAGVSEENLRAGHDHTLEELGMDSLAVMEVQAVLKDRYGVHIPEESLELSVAQLVEFVEEQLKEVR